MLTPRLASLLSLLVAAVPLTVGATLEERGDYACGAVTLKGAAGLRYFGAALAAGHLTNASDPTFTAVAKKDFSGVTPENEMKWEVIEPQQGQFNYTLGDIVANFANQNKLTLRGHTLVWHSQLAPWVSSIKGQALQAVLVNHINNVMGHYKNRIYAWDVVNEVFNEDGTLRVSPFLTELGSGYIETAFRTARATKSGAKLYINDYNIEGVNAKSDALYAVAKDLKKKGLLDGVGFQSHFVVGGVPSTIKQNFQRFADLGLDVAITELDIRGVTPLDAYAVKQHAQDWATTVNACTSVGKRCVGITAWGITDAYSWIPGVFTGYGYGLLWDDAYNKKPAYYATLEAL